MLSHSKSVGIRNVNNVSCWGLFGTGVGGLFCFGLGSFVFFFLNTKLLKFSTVWGTLFPAGGIKAECSHARHFFQVGSRKHGCF